MISKLRAFHEKHPNVLPFLVVFALIFVRYCYYGFQYNYQLDDYIPYHNYVTSGFSLTELINIHGMLSQRPLSWLFDVIIWARFFDQMLVAVALISALYAAAALMLRRVFARHFGCGSLFVVAMTLLPLGFEGTYWVAASTRVVVGMFFSALSLYFFDAFLHSGGKRRIPAFVLAQVVAYGLYEQNLIFSFAATILIAVVTWFEKPANLDQKLRRRRVALAGFTVLLVPAYFLFTASFPQNEAYVSRSQIGTPLTPGYLQDIFLPLLRQLKSVYLGGGVATLTRGTTRALRLIAESPNILYIALILTLTAAVFLLANRKPEANANAKARRPILAITIGLMLALAPLAPFFILYNPWFSFRGAVMTFPGFALIADTLLALILTRVRAKRAITAAVTAAFTLICCIAAVSELHDYKLTTERDMQITSAIAAIVAVGEETTRDSNIAVLNVSPTYLTDQNYYYHEHVHGVTESNWALTGMMEYRMSYMTRPKVTPLPAGEMYRQWNSATSRLTNFDALYFYLDGAVYRVALTPAANGKTAVTDADSGRLLAHTWETDNIGYLQLLT
ncbi:MAG: hypothetical protein LBN30_08125 [Oscillospiraceae bacterium]|jgi:hypothetical protein|nr:hypothetical protein [Oscillospiraceae bacterium]